MVNGLMITSGAIRLRVSTKIWMVLFKGSQLDKKKYIILIRFLLGLILPFLKSPTA